MSKLSQNKTFIIIPDYLQHRILTWDIETCSQSALESQIYRPKMS